MRATVMYGAGDVRVENMPDPAIREPTDAVVRVLRSAICGSDLWPLRLRRCRREPGRGGAGAARAGHPGQAARLGADEALLPSLLTLSDVFCTGHHAAVRAGVGPGTTVTVIGDGAVGLCAVLAVRRLGAGRILLLGRHKQRTDLGREFGATEVIAERGEEAAARVRELTGGDGTRAVLECVGTLQALQTALGAVRDGGVVSRIGVPQYTDGPIGFDMIMRNITLTGGACPARAYIKELLPDVLDGTVQPGRVFDRTISLDETPDGYRAMASREVLKVLIRP